jgi:membrane-associated protein
MKWIDPYHLIEYGGLSLALFMVFAESGLLFGIFLPGDTLLIAMGLLTSTRYIDIDIVTLLILVNIAAIGGYMAGYVLGYRSRHFIMDRIRLRKRSNYLLRALVLFRKNGTGAMILPRFLPFIRTFIPIAAGMTEFGVIRFFILNVLGSILWTSAFILPAYYLGSAFPGIINSIEWIMLIIIALLSIPVLKILVHKKRTKPRNTGQEL